MGEHGPITFSRDRWHGIKDHLQEKPLLDRMQPARIYMEPSDRYRATDSSRFLLRSGLSLPYFARRRGKSYAGAFNEENVVVIKDLGVFAFKELKEDFEKKWLSSPVAGYSEYRKFLSEIFNPYMTHDIPIDVLSFMVDLDGFYGLVEDLLLDDPALLPDSGYADILFEVHRLLRKELLATGKEAVSKDVLRLIGSYNGGALRACQRHPLLNHFVPDYLKNPAYALWPPENDYSELSIVGPDDEEQVNEWFRYGSSTDNLPTLSSLYPGDVLQMGKLVVDVNRIFSVHAVEEIMQLTKFLPQPSAMNLMRRPITRVEVIRFLRCCFPYYLKLVYGIFYRAEGGLTRCDWEKLGVRAVNPIPTLYYV